MTVLDDDLVEMRLRAAFRDIVQQDLAEGTALRSVPQPEHRRMSRWARPATIAAALVLVAGVVALVLALRDDRDGSTVVVDQGNSQPVRVIPGPLPEGTTLSPLGDKPLADSEAELGRHAVFAREDDGTFTELIIVLTGRELPPQESLSTRRTMDVGGATAWARDDGISTEYVLDHPTCGGTLAVSYRAGESDVLGVLRGLECGESVSAGPLPEGVREVGAEAVFGTLQSAVGLNNEARRSAGSWAVTNGLPPRAAFLMVAPDSSVETLTVAGRAVHRTERDGATLYEWSFSGAVVTWQLGPAGGGGPDMITAAEIEAVIGGSRAVSEAEWQTWLGTEQASEESEHTSTSMVREGSGSTSEPVRLAPGPLPAGSTVSSIADRSAADLAAPYAGVTKWGRDEGGEITSALFASITQLREPSGDRQVQDIHGRTVWIDETAAVATVYFVELEGCGLAKVDSYRAEEQDAIQLVGSFRCEANDLQVEGAPPDGYRAVSDAELLGTAQTIVSLVGTDGGVRLGTIAVTSGQHRHLAPYLLQARAAAIETLEVGGQVVHRARVGTNVVHAWYVDGASVAVASPTMTDAEVVALIAGSRVVTEPEWQEWAASVSR